MRGLFILLSALAAIIATAECKCYSTTIYATTSSYSKSVDSSVNEYCIIYIWPSLPYTSTSYYLEISWSSSNFDVKGNMPFCKEDYVEVFLTSSYRSIGKFCSNNAGKPFTMYSRDRYAKIVHSTDGYATGSGFKFYYRLRSKTSYPLGGTTNSSTCYNNYNYGSSGVMYSTGWPSNYKTSSISCSYKISKSSAYQGVYVVFMDVSLYYSYYSYTRDYVQLFGSNVSSSSYEKAISLKLYNTYDIKAYKTYSRYLKIEFDRRNNPSHSLSYRGFVAGYILFKNESNAGYGAIAIGRVLIPLIIVVIIVAAVALCFKKRKRHVSPAALYNQPQSNDMVPTVENTTTQQTQQNASSMPYLNLTYSQHKDMNPTSTIQNGSYTAKLYSISITTGPSYTNGQVATHANPHAQVSLMTASTHSSIPAEVVQPSNISGGQGQ